MRALATISALPTPPALATKPAHPATATRSFRYFWIGLTVYLGVHLALRLLTSQTLQHDEAEQPIFAQHLAPGYSGQPPLYTWMVAGLSQVLGMRLVTLALLKTAVLAALYGYLYLAGRLLLRDANRAALAVATLLTMPVFAWEFLRDYTHSPLVCAVAAATLHALLRLRLHGRVTDYAWLGVLFGLGMLAKYNYALFAGPLVAAALTVPGFRTRLLDRRAALTIAATVVVFAPHGVWLLEHHGGVRAFLASRAGIGLNDDFLLPRLHGVGSLFWNLVLFLTPWWLLMVACFPAAWRRCRPGPALPGDVHRLFLDFWERPLANEGRLLLGRFLLITLLTLLLMVMVRGVTRFFIHWLEPMLVLAPLYLFSRLEGVALPQGRLRACAAVLMASAVVVVGVRSSQAWAGLQASKFGARDKLFADQARLLRAAGFERGLLVTESHVIAGNLRLDFPNARATLPKYPLAGLPNDTASGVCVVFDATFDDAPPPHLLAFLRQELGIDSPLGQVAYAGLAEKSPHKHTNRLGYVLLPAR